MNSQLFAAIESGVGKLSRHSERLLQVYIPEETISDELGCLLREAGYRVTSRVNLWKFVEGLPPGRKAVTTLKTFRHPLQPDVDLLIEDHKDSNKLWGFEIKLIRWKDEPLWKVIPEGRLYSGLDQALAVATCGVDYACLCHIFIPPMAVYRRTVAAQGPKQAEQLDDDRIEFTAAYSGIVKGLLEHFNLPIGYIAIGLFSDQATETVETVLLNKPWMVPRALVPTPTGNRIRPLLLKAIDLAEKSASTT